VSARRGSGIAPATASVSCRPWMLTCHGGLTPPALVLPCECPSTKKRFLRCTYERSQERRVSARRGCYDDGLQCTSSNGRRIATVEQRAAGVSPPWIFKPRLQVPYAGFPRCELGESTGGLRPPLLYCRANVRRQKSDFCDAHTNVHKSGGCQPAVGLGSRTWSAVCRISCKRVFEATVGSRRPLLGGCVAAALRSICEPRSAHADRSCCTTLRPDTLCGNFQRSPMRIKIPASSIEATIRLSGPCARKRRGCVCTPLATLRRLRRASARK
jgi:hypothetical protein